MRGLRAVMGLSAFAGLHGKLLEGWSVCLLVQKMQHGFTRQSCIPAQIDKPADLGRMAEEGAE